MKDMHGPTMLVILDGFGYRKETLYNATLSADAPHLDQWLSACPHALLNAAGPAVGLLPGYIGNSEVGHLTMGSGRIVKQPITLIHNAITTGAFFNHELLRARLQELAKTGGRLHLMGLLSDAGVHSHEKHLYALLDIAADMDIKDVFVHAFLDGRDVAPYSAATYLHRLDVHMARAGVGELASMQGRFYAMDRDNHWKRTEKSYRVLTQPQPHVYSSWQEVLDINYRHHVSDEYVMPSQLTHDGIIKNGDGVIFFNVRADRARQLTMCFIDPTFDHFPIKPLNLLFFITATSYDNFPVDVLYRAPIITHTLKEILSAYGLTIFSIAETEKYAHITYFFDGGREEAFPNETRVLVPSLPEKNYSARPEMSAPTITRRIMESLTGGTPADFYLVNFANADMVGHSGDFEATVKAIECIDKQLGIIYDQLINKMNGTLYVTADHGNAEDMYDERAQQPRTAHTINPVPFVMITRDCCEKKKDLPLHQLADIAPFILHNLGLPIPKEMHHQ